MSFVTERESVDSPKLQMSYKKD